MNCILVLGFILDILYAKQEFHLLTEAKDLNSSFSHFGYWTDVLTPLWDVLYGIYLVQTFLYSRCLSNTRNLKILVTEWGKKVLFYLEKKKRLSLRAPPKQDILKKMTLLGYIYKEIDLKIFNV